MRSVFHRVVAVRPLIRAVLWLGLLSPTGCAGEAGHAGEEDALLLVRLRSGDVEHPNVDLSSEPFLGPTRRVVVQEYSSRPTFYVFERAPSMEQYPCTECHTVRLAAMRPRRRAEQLHAHWDLTLVHASDRVMRCTTCHWQGDLDWLTTLTGDTVSFDHSYQLCAQCHSEQGADWAGGAHGKREGGWALPRVVQTCVACHDPHRPTWDTRWPAHAGRTQQ